jgi:predicted Zn-dependent peptidase
MRPFARLATLVACSLVGIAARADLVPPPPKPTNNPAPAAKPDANVSAAPKPTASTSAAPPKPAAADGASESPAAEKKPTKKPVVKPVPKPAADKAPETGKKADATPEPFPRLRFDIKREKLDNGLRVVLLPDHTSPTVAVDVVYDVGGRNEERGRSGFAHLFEHMMFQGSANVPRGEHFRLVTSHGGVLNGTTNEDRTNYFEMLPSSELALGLWLEADRMKSLDVSQQNFENQRAVVKEEYRMRVENAAYVPAEIRLQELVYQGYWPYEHSAIGTMRDLDAAELPWVRAFHASYYAPNNAVLSITGDFDEAEAMALARKYFGDARPAKVPKLELPPLPEQTAPRHAVVEDAHAKLPALFMGWVGPPSGDPEHYALELAARLLGDGESSRLYRALVRERSLAIATDAAMSGLRGPDMLAIVVKLASGAKVEQAQKIVDGLLSDLARLGPSNEEMKKLRARVQARFLLGLQSNFARAQKLAELELYRGDATLLNSELDRYLAVTKDDIKRVVRKYLTANRRSIVEVKPGTTSADAKNEGEKK